MTSTVVTKSHIMYSLNDMKKHSNKHPEPNSEANYQYGEEK